MSAGLPGLGLGGLFFIFSALLAPFPELWRALLGRSNLAAWRAIVRQLAQALAMVAAIDLTLRLTYLVLSATRLGNPPAADEVTVLPLNLIGITTGLLVLVLVGAKLAELASRARSGGLPRVPATLPRVAPLRAAMVAAVAVIAWIALLATGASELSPLQRPRHEQIASPRAPNVDGGSRQDVAMSRRADRGPQGSAVATQPTSGGRGGMSGTPNGAGASGSGGGRATIAPAPVVVAPAPSSKPPAHPVPSQPAATPEAPSSSPPVRGTPAQPPPAPPRPPQEPGGSSEGAPASGGAEPAGEPPPQAPAKGLRDSK